MKAFRIAFYNEGEGMSVRDVHYVCVFAETMTEAHEKTLKGKANRKLLVSLCSELVGAE